MKKTMFRKREVSQDDTIKQGNSMYLNEDIVDEEEISIIFHAEEEDDDVQNELFQFDDNYQDEEHLFSAANVRFAIDTQSEELNGESFPSDEDAIFRIRQASMANKGLDSPTTLEETLSSSPSRVSAKGVDVPRHGSVWLGRLLDFYSSFSFILHMLWVIWLAKIYPPMGSQYVYQEISVEWVAVCTLFVLAGLNLRLSMLTRICEHGVFNLFVQIYSFIFVSAVMFGLSRLVIFLDVMSEHLADGMVICACLPMTINMVVVLSRESGGHERAASFNAVCANLMGVALTPVLIVLYLGTDADVTEVCWNISLRVVYPLLGGLTIQRVFKGITKKAKKQRSFLIFIQKVCLLFIIYVVFCRTFDNADDVDYSDVAALIFFQTLALLLLMGVSWFLLGLAFPKKPRQRVMGLFGSTHKTIAMGVPLLTTMYADNPRIALYTLPLLVWHPMQLIIGSVLAPRLKIWVERENRRLGDSRDHDDYDGSLPSTSKYGYEIKRRRKGGDDDSKMDLDVIFNYGEKEGRGNDDDFSAIYDAVDKVEEDLEEGRPQKGPSTEHALVSTTNFPPGKREPTNISKLGRFISSTSVTTDTHPFDESSDQPVEKDVHIGKLLQKDEAPDDVSSIFDVFMAQSFFSKSHLNDREPTEEDNYSETAVDLNFDAKEGSSQRVGDAKDAFSRGNPHNPIVLEHSEANDPIVVSDAESIVSSTDGKVLFVRRSNHPFDESTLVSGVQLVGADSPQFEPEILPAGENVIEPNVHEACSSDGVEELRKSLPRVGSSADSDVMKDHEHSFTRSPVDKQVRFMTPALLSLDDVFGATTEQNTTFDTCEETFDVGDGSSIVVRRVLSGEEANATEVNATDHIQDTCVVQSHEYETKPVDHRDSGRASHLTLIAPINVAERSRASPIDTALERNAKFQDKLPAKVIPYADFRPPNPVFVGDVLDLVIDDPKDGDADDEITEYSKQAIELASEMVLIGEGEWEASQGWRTVRLYM